MIVKYEFKYIPFLNFMEEKSLKRSCDRSRICWTSYMLDIDNLIINK